MTTAWTRRSVTEAKDLLEVMTELAHDTKLVRSVRAHPRRVLIDLIPEQTDTYWMSHNGHLPKPSWCKTCRFPSALGKRYACPKHAKRPPKVAKKATA
jgi:hypothetical protein